MKIVVLKGGTSSEREVSLHSGDKISQALQEEGHELITLDTVLPLEQLEHSVAVTPGHLQAGATNVLQLLTTPQVRSADFIFNALHGGSGENGHLQAVLQLMGYAFNGSATEGCAIAMDKVVSKLLFERYNIPTPDWQHFNRANAYTVPKIENDVLTTLDFPLVVKPSNEGSTVGLTVVSAKEQLGPAIENALQYNNEIIAEKFIPGREITVALLGDQALPIVEIIPRHGIYDYDCKYTQGMSRYIVPATLELALARRIQQCAVLGFKALKCAGYGRMDIRLGEDGTPYFLELNTLPGMTDTSLVPKAAQAAGYSFTELLEQIIALGMQRQTKYKEVTDVS